MFNRIGSLFRQPRASGPPRLLKHYDSSERTISLEAKPGDEGAWHVSIDEPGTVRLFELAEPGIDNCMVTYRAQMKSVELGGAYLEMWARLPGAGEFFSRGLNRKVAGTTDWASYQIPFLFKAGQRPDMLKLNVVVEGGGELWVKDVEVLWAPLA